MKLPTQAILRAERLKRAKTQQQIADYLHITREAYTLYETGKNMPTTENLIKLADLYNCSVDYLLGRYSYIDVIKENINSGIKTGEELADNIVDNIESKEKKKNRKKAY